MKLNDKSAAKRTYSAPKLVTYGDMAMLTKGGGGSVTEMGKDPDINDMG